MKRIEGNKSAKRDWFKDKYYACPKTLKQVFLAIQDPTLGDLAIPNPDPSHLLEAFYFLKKYPTKIELAGFNDSCEKTALKRVWKYTFAVAALKERKVMPHTQTTNFPMLPL